MPQLETTEFRAAMPDDFNPNIHDHEYWDDDDVCGACGGAGVFEDECTCGDDTCCCLVPEPPICPECKGNG